MRRAVNIEKENKGQNKNKKIKQKLDIKLNKRRIMALSISLLVILCVIAINNYTTLGLVFNKNINEKDTIQIELQTSNNRIIPFGNEILVYNNGIITIYNNYGRATGEIKLEDTVDADILTAGQYIQAINKDKGIVYIYKNKYEVARIKIEGRIYSGNINAKGMSVIEYSSNGNKTQLGIYDNSGKIRYNVKLSNKIIGKYVLSDDSKYLAYVDVNVYGISVCTNINLIDLNNIKEDGQNTLTIHTMDNCLAYDIYWHGRNVVARFDENYMIYDANSAKKQVVEITDGQVIAVGDYDNKCAYIELNENGDYMLNIRKMGSNRLKVLQLSDAPKYFKYEEGIIYVCYGKKIEAYNNFGINLKKYNSNMVITEPIVFNNGRSVAMAISNKLIIFTI